MLHKNSTQASNSLGPTLVESRLPTTTKPSPTHSTQKAAEQRPWFDLDFVRIAARRCSSFFAEAAVLVLIFGNLDYFMLKGHMELPWIAGVFVALIVLLAGSVLTEARAQRWIDAHP